MESYQKMKQPGVMKAMVLENQKQPLVLKTLPVPVPKANQILIKIIACGVCRTDLHIADGELSQPKLPLIMGHEIVGTVVKIGDAVIGFNEGEIVGVPWLGYTCGACKYCLSGKENLCEKALFTGYALDGGYAEYTVAYAKYCFRLNRKYANANGAPITLCRLNRLPCI